MKTRDLIHLISLGLLWGASFLFIRVAAPEFGAVALIEVRVFLAALVFLPVVFFRRLLPEIKKHWRPILMMGLLHYAIPFTLFAYSMLTLTGGYSAIINASSPMFAMLVAWLWLGERPVGVRVAGLVVGLFGVAILVSDKLATTDGSVGLAIAAAVAASFCYGYAAVLAKKKLAGVNPTAVSAGSMIASAIVLLPASFFFWPQAAPTSTAWSMAIALGVLCTAFAFVLYFRLIASVGPTRAINVTFLIPVFAVLLGAIFIGEKITVSMAFGGAIILLGTAMSVGLIDVSSLYRRHKAAIARAFASVLVAITLNDIPEDVHAAESEDWETSVSASVAANTFYFEEGGQTDSFATLAASAEMELTRGAQPWAISLFAEHHFSDDDRVDGTVFIGGQFSILRDSWDISSFAMAAQFPGASTEPAVAVRIRRSFTDGLKLGVEYINYIERPGSAELKLGYYGSLLESMSLKITVGRKLNESRDPIAHVGLSWSWR